MARVGWVGAGVVGTEPEEWYRLAVFDDGWVELPGLARGAARVRGDLRLALLGVAVIVVFVLLFLLLPHLGLPDDVLSIVSMVLGLVFVAALLVLVGIQLFRSLGRLRANRGDYQQARRRMASSVQLRRTPGAPRFKRAGSAAELASWLSPVRLVRAADITAVDLGEHGDDAVATVHMHDGSTRSYRSPDRAELRRLLGGFAPGSPPGI